MGVPALFSNVVRTHPNIIKTLGGVTVCQSSKARVASAKHNEDPIVYDCVHRMQGQTNDQKIIDVVCKQINSYIKLVKPSETVIIAFDGVAQWPSWKTSETTAISRVYRLNNGKGWRGQKLVGHYCYYARHAILWRS